MVDGLKWTDTPDADFCPAQVTEKPSILGAKNRPPNPSRFKFERVNEVTLKLTNGELTNVPASHGQWGGYRATKAIAWVICLRDMACGPSSVAEAKAAAMAMAKGAVGDYRIANAVTHLNGLTARLSEWFGDAA
jgi:hypothetical protein